jgi:hypothetical protein
MIEKYTIIYMIKNSKIKMSNIYYIVLKNKNILKYSTVQVNNKHKIVNYHIS